MAQPNKTYRQTLSGSIGAGMSSVFKPNSRRYYILEHKVTSKYHRAGEAQEIIVDQIELGRDSHCQVRFDDHFSTVSRHHAAIVKDGDGWKLVQVSKTNTTLLNGHPVRTEWYLQNGDEIQLSINGPKLGFIIPTGKKATVGSIGLTRRLSLFRQQALRPYKTAIMSLAALLVLALGIGGFVIYKQDQQIKDNSKLLAEAKDANAKNEELLEEQRKIIDNQDGVLDSLKKVKPKEVVRERVVVKREVVQVPSGGGGSRTVVVQASESGGNSGKGEKPLAKIDYSAFYPSIYYITTHLIVGGDEVFSSTGTGFQTNSGRFITARHCVCPYYWADAFMGSDKGKLLYMLLNVELQSGNSDGFIQVVCECVNYKGDRFTFDGLKAHQNGQEDEVVALEKDIILNEETKIPAGTRIRLAQPGRLDYAYISRSGQGLKENRSLSSSMKQGTELFVLGYPNGWSKGEAPILSTAVAAQNGLSSIGTIMTSNDNTHHGNSGGPLFAMTESGAEVVGIVSFGLSDRNGQKIEGKTFYVPISALQ